MSQFKVYISRPTTVIVVAQSPEAAERIALQDYRSNSPAVEHFAPVVDEVEQLDFIEPPPTKVARKCQISS